MAHLTSSTQKMYHYFHFSHFLSLKNQHYCQSYQHPYSILLRLRLVPRKSLCLLIVAKTCLDMLENIVYVVEPLFVHVIQFEYSHYRACTVV